MPNHESLNTSYEQEAQSDFVNKLLHSLYEIGYNPGEQISSNIIVDKLEPIFDRLEQIVESPDTPIKTLITIAKSSDLSYIDAYYSSHTKRAKKIQTSARKTAKKRIAHESIVDQQIKIDLAKLEETEAQKSVDELDSDELRELAEEKMHNGGYKYRDMVDIATTPQCPIDVTMDILMDIYMSRYRSVDEYQFDNFVDAILSRLTEILYNKDTSVDVIEYIADSETLSRIGIIHSYQKAKEVRKLARKIFHQTGATREYKIEDEVSKRKREKKEQELKKRNAEAVERAIACANSPDASFRQKGAESEFCPIDILIKLATEDPSSTVRSSAARNKNQTPDALRAIYKVAISNNDYDLISAVFQNENSPLDISLKSFEELQTRWETMYGRADWKEISVITNAARALVEKIDSPEMPIEALEELREKYRYAQPPLRQIFVAARNKLTGIHLNNFIGRTVPNPRRFYEENPEPEPSEAEKLEQSQTELEQRRQADEAKKAELQEKSVKLLEALKQVKQLAEEIEASEAEGIHIFAGKHRIGIPESELIIEVDGHRELNPKYLPYINYIDFALLDTANLKVSGIDWSGTNIRIDPQTVFGKNLSGARFNDGATTFGNFEGCDLTGCDLSEELESYGFD
ncbi:hypothetical protein J6X15_04930, partial [Candidatus Saccharibacteria bacterium]|nr:hypothetical protein [Candidatus Saccharibacteria bacterium]